ncbi:hypothetical protein ACODT5_26525 [Streptomyces sp. 5.8]
MADQPEEQRPEEGKMLPDEPDLKAPKIQSQVNPNDAMHVDVLHTDYGR